jgi:cellulose synthase/poly-beta-1,6-N-acetylglucosamine synthase-like glycosyltransferase
MIFFEIFMIVSVFLTTAYIVFILLFNNGLSKTLKIKTSRTSNPSIRISVIIPVRNEASNILRCLEDLTNQDYPKDLFDVLITDDFSDDNTCRLVQAYIEKNQDRTLFLIRPGKEDQDQTGKKWAISRAVAEASGELIMTTDADTIHEKSWISTFVVLYISRRPQMILGTVAFHREERLLQKIQSLEFMGIMAVTAGSAWYNMPLMCNGASLGFTKDAFLKTGGYGGNFGFASGDDMFLLTQITQRYKAGSVLFAGNQNALTLTVAERCWKGFINQRIRWISKNRGYSDPWIRIFSLLTWSVNFLLLIGMFLGLADYKILYLSLALWLGKILSEYLLVSRMSKFLKKRSLTGYYFIAQVFQLFYVTILGFLGNFLPYRWKGRFINK